MNTVSDSVLQDSVNKVFDKYDINNDGKLSNEELVAFLKDTLSHLGKKRDTS
jgi:Ca2+-binding EF-hand superfamily protein